jgi:hypothetical protein
MDASSLRCVACGNEQVQKVSSIVRGGAWSGVSSSSSIGGGHVFGGPDFVTVGVTQTRKAGATELAQTLMPPPTPPERRSDSGCAIVLLIMVGLAFAASGVSNIGGEGGSLAGGILMLAIAGLVGLAVYALATAHSTPKARAQREEELARWHTAMVRWDRLFYCPRCDRVYNPRSGDHYPAHQMAALLAYD